MKLLPWRFVIVIGLLGCVFAQSSRVRDSAVIEQQDSPLAFSQWKGSAVVVKNLSRKQIARFQLVCVARTGKKYDVLDTFDPSEDRIDPGSFGSEGGFDATPLNVCRSKKGLLAVATVRFSDGTEWKTHLTRSTDGATHP